MLGSPPRVSCSTKRGVDLNYQISRFQEEASYNTRNMESTVLESWVSATKIPLIWG